MLRSTAPSRAAALAAAAVTSILLLCIAATAQAGAAMVARGSVEQVQVTGVTPGHVVILSNRNGKDVQKKRAGTLGGLVFRNVSPGAGYRVISDSVTSGALTVLTQQSAPPSTSIYNQTIPTKGYGYLTTRDGTQLAINVQLPSGPGPYPTLIEYSGYGYANPAGGEASTAQLANILGFAVVDVNMRGTGCSGGAFDYFEPLQGLDGYDVIETVARQPWVLHNKVGMMGVSYGGISQLFTAATAPPSLAAITPLSVIDATQTTLYPGGLLNTGFALSWAKDRVHDALPASPTGGQGWALKRINEGDATCKANQDLHPEAIDLLGKIAANKYYIPKVADPLAPVTFVKKIKAPVFLACQWTDEQTGGHCGALPREFTGTKKKWFTFTNGTHIDSLDPVTFNRWYDFLELYVARRAPSLSAGEKALAPTVFKAVMGVDGINLPADPIQDLPSYDAALAAWEKQPPVWVAFDNGAGGPVPGAPVAGFEKTFSSFPPRGIKARSWYFGARGTMSTTKTRRSGSDRFRWDTSARPATSFTGNTGSGKNGLWTATPGYQWLQPPAGTAASYLSAPMSADTTVLGAGSVQAWIKSTSPRLDLQVTVTEVRPDGKETFVQGGWLRTSARKLDPKKSTLLEPVPTLRKADDKPLPKGRYSEVWIPLYYQGHVYRKGSRIRILISAPGGDQPIWVFGDAAPKGGTPTVTVGRSKTMPSRVVLPVLPGMSVPTPLPPCPGLRGEPCRAYPGPVPG